jgi:Flagellar biosynthesis pathway, component FliP
MAAKEKESKALPEGQAENPKKPSKIKRIVILLAILLMVDGWNLLVGSLVNSFLL